MSPQHAELERLTDCLRGLVDEHRKLLDLVRRHESAMKAMDTEAIDALSAQQEQSRTRIVQWEARRRLIVPLLAKSAKLTGDMTLPRLAAAFPTHRAVLLVLREELRDLATQIKQRTAISTRIAHALVGHLNTAVRLLAGAAERGGVYTKQGTAKLTRRLGSMEAVG